MSSCSFSAKGEYPENWHFVFCPNKQHSFERFLCLDLTVSRVLEVRRETEFGVDVESIDNLLIVMRIIVGERGLVGGGGEGVCVCVCVCVCSCLLGDVFI